MPDYVSPAEAQQLWDAVYAVPRPRWTALRGRRLQNWGGTPRKDGSLLLEPLPAWLQRCADRLVADGIFPAACAPNHVLVNEYAPGQGIMPHEDGPFYVARVATISLGSHTVLQIMPRPHDDAISDDRAARMPVPCGAGHADGDAGTDGGCASSRTWCGPCEGRCADAAAPRPVHLLLLEPRSLLVLTEALYTRHLHGIEARVRDAAPSAAAYANADRLADPLLRSAANELVRGTRVSLTLRRGARTRGRIPEALVQRLRGTLP